jgi:mRNA-degrading endonuclease RelE of RelBE toxin-antitoxin system
MPYEVDFAASVKLQLDALPAGQRARVLDMIERQLVHGPLAETRNRKPLRPNPVAPWELRVGEIRVFYDVEESDVDADVEQAGAKGTVHVLAVGWKTGNVLRISGKEIEL